LVVWQNSNGLDMIREIERN